MMRAQTRTQTKTRVKTGVAVAMVTIALGGVMAGVATLSSKLATTSSTSTVAAVDTAASKVTAFSITPATIDTSKSDQVLTLVTTIKGGNYSFSSSAPSSSEAKIAISNRTPNQAVYFRNFKKIPGTTNDYTATAIIKKGSTLGVWSIEYLETVNKAGNTEKYLYDDLSALGATGLDIKNQDATKDNAAPSVTSLTITPISINTNDGDQTLKLVATIKDDMSGVCVAMPCGVNTGVGMTRLEMLSDAIGHDRTYDVAVFKDFKRTNQTSDKYTATAIIKKGKVSGAWKVNKFFVVDNSGNQRIYSYTDLKALGATKLEIMNKGITDTNPPVVTSFSITPTMINTTKSNQILKLTATIDDDLSGLCLGVDCLEGIGAPGLLLQSDATVQYIGHPYAEFSGFKKDPGTANKYTATAVIKKGESSGMWKIQYFTVFDKIGNRKYYSYDDLKNIGATGLDITNN